MDTSEAVNGVADVKTEEVEVDEDVVYAAEDETVDNEKEEAEITTDAAADQDKITVGTDQTASKEEDKDTEEKEPIRVIANFDLGRYQDVMKLEAYINNCTSFVMRVGKSKSADCKITYETDQYVQDVKEMKELQIRGKHLGNLKIHGIPVEPAAQVFVKNIPEDTLDDLLQMLFPEATKITMPKAKDGKSKGCAMLVFATKSDAEKCVEENTGIKIEENTLTLEIRVKPASNTKPPARSVAKSKAAVNLSKTTASSKNTKSADKKVETKKPSLKRPATSSSSRVQTSSKRPRVELRSSNSRREQDRPRRYAAEPRPEVVANRMANEMAVKMQQMQERMTERIISQVASKISLQTSGASRDQTTRRPALANQGIPRRSLGGKTSNNPATRGRLSDSSINCFTCGETGHYARDCGSQECYRCGKYGHFARECPTTLSGATPDSRIGGSRLQKRDDAQMQGQRSQFGLGQSGPARGQMVMQRTSSNTNGMFVNNRSSDDYVRQLEQQQGQQEEQRMNYYF